jgi:5-methylcytosine-specific restriction protein B
MNEIRMSSEEWEEKLNSLFIGSNYVVIRKYEPATPSNVSVDIYEQKNPSDKIIRIWPKRTRVSAVISPEVKAIVEKQFPTIEWHRFKGGNRWETLSETDEPIWNTCVSLKGKFKDNVEVVNSNSDKLEEKFTMKRDFDKNTILFGPPGTGKTYCSAIYAVAICDGKSLDDVKAMDYKDVRNRYNELMNMEHRIAFTTFHQSYGYEEFIEGIKPVINQETDDTDSDIQYTVESGVFKRFCETAKRETIRTDVFDVSDDAVVWKVTIRKGVIQDCFDNNQIRIDFKFDSKGAYRFINDMKPGDLIVTTDGSRTLINGVALVTSEDAYEQDVDSDKTTRDVQWLAKGISENITSINNGKKLSRKTCSRVPNASIGELIDLAKKYNTELENTDVTTNDKPYVFIIDEINRGNISKIFGELITLIEDSKREGEDEATSAILPYSGDDFSVPNNVYILGTMNTADRSIALMDTALRRRFHFVEMMPDIDVLNGITVNGLNISKMLAAINNRIEFLYDREHTIGHAYFTELRDDPSIDKLASIFEKSLIPLLQEYFYEDYQKIQLVLGDNAKYDDNLKFIKDIKIVAKDVFAGNVEDVIDLPDKKYEINPMALLNIESYKEIAPGQLD